MNILDVKNLSKTYPAFQLKDVSFSLEKGKITGLIGRNGAGKSTTLKSILNFVHPDSGDVKFFGKSFCNNENEIKQRMGFVSGGVNYYGSKKIKTITSVTNSFFENWDSYAYKKYMDLFKLDENKTPAQLSEGMKVKYALTLALSHNAELLIMDEPTSGLDPVSRDELLDIFLELCDKGVTILFSTHITSDLDKCADNIIYIKNGEVLVEDKMEIFVSDYRIIKVSKEQKELIPEQKLQGYKRIKNGYSVLVKEQDVSNVIKNLPDNITPVDVDLEDIMVHVEKEDLQ